MLSKEFLFLDDPLSPVISRAAMATDRSRRGWKLRADIQLPRYTTDFWEFPESRCQTWGKPACHTEPFPSCHSPEKGILRRSSLPPCSLASSLAFAALVFLPTISVADQLLDAPGPGYHEQAIRFLSPSSGGVIYRFQRFRMGAFDTTVKGMQETYSLDSQPSDAAMTLDFIQP